MRRSLPTSLFLLLAANACPAAVDFARDVRPIFEKHCFSCHGETKQKGGLRLDVKAAALKGGEEHGSAILAGNSKQSPLIKFTSGEDKDLLMPPKGERLSDTEVQTLKQWIDAGALWPDDGVALNDPLKTHWAFQSVKRPAVPNNTQSSSIDVFIEEKLAEKGLKMSPPADGRVLVRRMYFDVVGLPPTPEQIATFTRAYGKDADLAVRKLADDLLASPHYGERWARHWLDVVRFAESDGFEKNSARANAWPYRDYVIRALNEDRPYDQFVKDQLAGDSTGQDEATGFLVGGAVDTVKSPDPVLTAQQRADELNDMVSATGAAFMGLTLNCARCHTHKFDPVSHTDYHAIAAVFSGVRHGERTLKPSDYDDRMVKAKKLEGQLEGVQTQLARFEPAATTARTLVIHPEDKEHTIKLQMANAKRTTYEGGTNRGEKSYTGTEKDLPTLGDGYWVWLHENAKGDVFQWKPKAEGKFRVWISWGSGYKSHDEDARYIFDRDGNPKTTGDQMEIGKADHRKFADGSGTTPNRKLWSGFKDLGMHEFTASSSLILRVGGDEGYPTADVLVLQEDLVSGDASDKAQSPRVRVPVKRSANTERFAATSAKFVRFTIEDTTQLQPCMDELEVFTTEEKPRNVALASLGAKASASSTLPGYAIHQVAHLNDGLYGNDHSWISDEPGKGWVQIEFAKPEMIDRVVWSRDRDNVPRYNDRLPTKYAVEISQNGTHWVRVASHHDRLDAATKLGIATIARADGLPASEAMRFQALQGKRTQLSQLITDATTMPMAYAGKFAPPVEIHRYQRGDVTQPREIVAPNALASLGPKITFTSEMPEHQRRLALAEWLVRREHPLTARVIANRLWHYHFGTGIVDTPSDFGVNGGKPSHPALLDWLASELMDSDWSLKHLHRLILNSAAYRQDSATNEAAMKVDVGSRLLWRFPPRRMEAEPLRDTILAVSGSLDLKMGGPGFDLFEPNTNYVKVYTTKTDYGPTEFRRMVYQNKPRVELDNIFGTFDCPDAGQATPSRTLSTTPLQALSLLNSKFAVQQAELFAARVQREAGSDTRAQINRAFLLAFGRESTTGESNAAEALVREYGLPALCRALYNANEFLQIR
ncbi:F5/8 type C domain-containing protein [Roseimicrobium gellanilyticum]|uniref:F5/8 type C domain-containing protein n=1 Tax=Roseimicrobium gellanilyticum TaxID=748857 RepID=A0A366HNT2_9BACT|nr:DUF1553 domain-containing protein [Roseimicrobium gellanilyticum]RBP45156.1 F5/8 type C domain-containing protein [Roseimicrobium gellanilyticum]